MKTKDFKTTLNQQNIDCYVLENAHKMRVFLSNYGARTLAIEVPDKHHQTLDVTLGYDSIEEHIQKMPYFGAIIGRYANRIAKGQFQLNGTNYQLDVNNGSNHLHGGARGFSHRIWSLIEQTGNMLKLQYVSEAGEEHYPGKLTSEICFTLSDDNALSVEVNAKSDADTIVNFTMHPYFNLDGQAGSDVLNHRLKINADSYLSIDSNSLPVKKTLLDDDAVFDFRNYKAIGQDINAKHEQLGIAGGYDHNFILSEGANNMVASLYSPQSGIKMDVYTNQPGLQVYSVNWEDGSIVGKGQKPYAKHAGICLEPQHFPDSPNHPEFPSVKLKKGENYCFYTKYCFTNGD